MNKHEQSPDFDRPPIEFGKKVDIKDAMIRRYTGVFYSRRGYRRYRDRMASAEKEKNQQREISLEDKKVIDLGARAFNSLTGLSIELAEEGARLVFQEPDRILEHYARPLVNKFDQKYLESIAAFRSAIEAYEKWLETCRQHPIAEHLAEFRAEDQEIKRALVEAGARLECCDYSEEEVGPPEYVSINPDEANWNEVYLYSLEGATFFEHMLSEMTEKLDLYEDNRLTPQRTIAEHLEQLYKIGNVNLVNRYANDLMWELEEGKRAIVPVVLANPDFYRKGRYATFSDLDAVVESMEREYAHILSLTELKSGKELFLSLKPKGESPVSYARAAANAGWKMDAQGTSLATAVELVRAAHDSQKLEVLDLCASCPNAISLYDQLKRRHIKHDVFLPFLINEAKQRISPSSSSKTIIDAICEIFDQSQDHALASALIRSGHDLWEDARFLSLAEEALAGHEGRIALTKAYATAHSSEAPNRMTAVAAVGSLDLSAARIEALLEVIKGQPETELGWANDASIDPSQIVSKLDQLSPRKKKKGRGGKQKGKAPASLPRGDRWLTRIRDSIERGQVAGLNIETFDQAVQAMPEGLIHRINWIWQHHPNALIHFTNDLSAHSENPDYIFLVGNFELFRTYIERIEASASSEIAADLEAADKYASQSLFRFWSWRLRDDATDKLLLEIESVPNTEVEVDHSRIFDKPYSKILVFGGQYNGEALRKLKETADPNIDLRFHNIHNRNFDLNSIDSSTLVIWVTSSNSHSYESIVKRKAILTGATYCFHIQSGYQSLAEKLTQVKAQKPAA